MKKNIKVNFLVVGAQKSGTTALDRYLRQHPEIEMGSKKELHFFDHEKNFLGKANYDQYHQHFAGHHSKIRGECTPIYMYWRPAMERIYQYNPDMKIIAVLRDPIARAFSHWNLERERNADHADFSFAIREEKKRCEAALPLQHRVFSYIDRGFYDQQIKRIWRYFPKMQTLFIKHENLKRHPQITMKAIADFLDIADFKDIQPLDINSTKYSATLSEDDYKYLKEIFDDSIKETEKLLS